MDIRTAIAVVGIGAIMPDANDADQFWQNILNSKYSITEVPEQRWHPDLFYHPDPKVPDKTYSKIGGWVKDFRFNPMDWGIMIPPKVLENMDDSQKWAIAASRQALQDYGFPRRPLDVEKVAVILGNAMAGEHHYQTNLRIHAPEFTKALSDLSAFKSLPSEIQKSLLAGMLSNIQDSTPPINEDTMPGELSNIIAGRVANVYNFGGANFVTDAACASSLAALQSAVEGLVFHKFDAVLTGGIDRNMGPGSYVKFSKIGALSPDGSRPYADGANGFVMGEGAAVFLLKRLEDAERDGDKIYAVIRGIGSSSDGKGKGITAPNPVGQERAIARAWKNANVNPASVGLIEGHGTSTRVGDRVETQSLASIFGNLGLDNHSVGLGSVKSNIGHLKSAAGAAGLLKAIYALDKKTLPPSANFHAPNPEINFSKMPFFVVTEPLEWKRPAGEIRRAGVSSFGFGGTNFHVVLEEYVPGMNEEKKKLTPIKSAAETITVHPQREEVAMSSKATPGITNDFTFLGEDTATDLINTLTTLIERANEGSFPASPPPDKDSLTKQERLVISYTSTEDLIKKAQKAIQGLESDQETHWKAYASRGIYRGSGKPGKVAFLFPGQGSQYANMLKDLADQYPVVAETFAEADQIMTSHLGKPLTKYIFTEDTSEEAIGQLEEALKDTTITQPAVLTANIAIMRLLAQYNIKPDALIGHSLGEYGALVASNALSFKDALEVVSARGHAMAALEVEDNGCMAAVLAPIEEVEKIIATVDDYVVLANINSPVQSVVGGNVKAVELAIEKFKAAGMQAVKIPVSHAFHTKIVAPAAETLRKMIEGMDLQIPELPIAANVTGEFYPDSHKEIIDMLSDHIASPVQFVKGVQTLYDSGCRVFIESGPKRVLNSLANDILKEYDDATIIATNHPRKGGVESFHEALCQCYALGLGYEKDLVEEISLAERRKPEATRSTLIHSERSDPQQITGSVVISGAGLGLPGRDKPVFSDDNIERILKGESFIEPLPTETRQIMLDKKVTRLIKSDSGAQMVTLDDIDQTIKLAGQSGPFDLAEEFGVPKERVSALDITTQLAMAAGIDALRDAGIPLVMHYKQTSTGSYLPDRWMLPSSLQDETGVIFGSAFPGLDRLSEEADRYYLHRQLTRQLEDIEQIKSITPEDNRVLLAVLDEKISTLKGQINQLDYHFDRKFVFRVLTMGHSQFAEYIGARGPNTAVNAACATTTHAISIAEDWIRSGRCRRVIIVAGDDVTGGSLVSWVGPGLLASGATTTEGNLEKAALPFDRRRNGMVVGMGAAALVIESEDAVRERGMQGIVEILSTDTANSAFHGTRLDVNHVSQIMQRVVDVAEKRFGIDRKEIASKTMFMSHETYTPARGGSAAAEIEALNATFASAVNQIMIANTKGYTGHTMGVGVEDVVAVKALEQGIVPPIANIHRDFEPDPDLGDLNLSKGGPANIQYALRLGAGFGSQIAMTLFRKIPGAANQVRESEYKRWLEAISGYQNVELEVEKRTLRIMDKGVPSSNPEPSQWVYGHGPTLWAKTPEQEKLTLPETAQTEEEATAVKAAKPLPTEEEIKDFLLNLVSEKTGYPVEILEMDLDLEADLGIDTVKQAELFSAVRENYDIPRREDLMLVDYNTLQKVVEFVQESLAVEPVSEPAPVQLTKEPVPAKTAHSLAEKEEKPKELPSEDEIKEFLLNLVSEKTGYPVEILELDLDLEADLGIDTVKQAELFSAVRENYNIPRREDLMLVDYNTLEKVIGFVQDSLNEQISEYEESAIPVNAEESIESPAMEREPAPTRDEIKAFLLNLVSEKTGYPVEILDLDLDLEADLGIDTVKQAELFSSVRENYNIPRREDLMLVDYNTLDKVIGFVEDSLAEVGHSEPPTSPIVSPAEFVKNYESVADDDVDELEPEPILRRVPVPMLRPRLDLCESTGVDISSNSRILVVEDQNGVADELVKLLIDKQATVFKIKPGDPEKIEDTLQSWLAEGAFTGVFFLPSLDHEPPLLQMRLENWEKLIQNRVYTLSKIMRTLGTEVFLISATTTGGLHGTTMEQVHSTGGGVSGFSKALAMERSEALVKVVDFHPQVRAADIAATLLSETLNDPAVVEVGYEQGQRFGITIEESPWNDEEIHQLPPNSVFLVTGGTGGITHPIVRDLAKNTNGTFYLTGRSELPKPDDPNLVVLQSEGRDGLQKFWIERIAEQSKKVTPLELRTIVDRFVRASETLECIDAINQAGGKAHYLVADITNPEDVEKVVIDVLQEEGRIDVLVHAAGFERSRKLEKKTMEEFKRTMDVKASGFFYLYQSLRDHNGLPQEIVLFSSVAGRFGNLGQTDYAAANDLITKMAGQLNSVYPQLRVTTIDWGPWDEVGMASRGSIPRLMAFAGIEMLDPELAARSVYSELTRGGGGEVIFAHSLGMLENQITLKSGLDIDKANQALRSGNPLHVMLSDITGFDQQNGVTFEVTLDPNAEPFLHDHSLNGTPLFPGVMGIEGFSVAAQHVASVLGSGNPPGLQITELENIQFQNAFKFYQNKPRHIIWKAIPLRRNSGIEVYVTLESLNPSRLEKDPELVQHFSGTVHLSTERQPIQQLVTVPPSWNGKFTLKEDEIYNLYFHGPAFQVLEGVQRDEDGLLGKLNTSRPPFTSQPVSLDTNPVLIELCLQTAGIWEIGKTGALSLPKSIGRVRLYRRETNGEPIFAHIQPIQSNNGLRFNSRVVDSKGRIYLELQDYRTATLPASFEGKALTPLRKLVNGDES